MAGVAKARSLGYPFDTLHWHKAKPIEWGTQVGLPLQVPISEECSDVVRRDFGPNHKAKLGGVEVAHGMKIKILRFHYGPHKHKLAI